MISPKINGILDYLFAIILIILPWIVVFTGDNGRVPTCVIVGCLTFVYSLLTVYPLTLFKIIPFRFHLMLDVLAAAFLMLGPIINGWNSNMLISLLIGGIFEISIVFLSWHKQYWPKA